MIVFVPRRTTHFVNISGAHVRKSRHSKGWSQDELAVQCQLAGWDVTRGTIAKIEGHERLVTDYELKVLASVLGVDVREWLK